MNLLLLFPLFSVAFGLNLVHLNELKGGGQHYLIPGTAPYGIYVSAKSDSSSALGNIFVVSNGVEKSLNELRSRKVNGQSGELLVYAITDSSAYVFTTLLDKDMATLKGLMFISSSSQLNDKNFHVYDISNAFSIPSTTQGDLTYLFLNTNYGTNPYKSSIISQWNQTQNTAAYIYTGIPTDHSETKNTQIFSNPVQSDNNYTPFIGNVEKFSLTLETFYMKTKNGAPGFRIEPGYSNINGMTTTAYTTTGFYMKASGQTDSRVKVNIKRDAKYSGISGASMLGKLPTLKQVTYGFYEGASSYEHTEVGNPFISPWSIPTILSNFEVYSNGGDDAQYFVQYFISQGSTNGNPTTSLPSRQTTAKPGAPTVPGHVETTTSSSGTIQFLISLIMFMVFIF